MLSPKTFIPLILTLALLAGCGANPAYETPEKTAMTYVENGPPLAGVISIPFWNYTWNGLSKESQQWFLDNWETICDRPGHMEACGQQTNPAKQKMVAFGEAIVRHGPGKYDKVKDVDIDGKTAEVTFKNWKGTMYLVKEGANWKIDELFGIEDLPPTKW